MAGLGFGEAEEEIGDYFSQWGLVAMVKKVPPACAAASASRRDKASDSVGCGNPFRGFHLSSAF